MNKTYFNNNKLHIIINVFGETKVESQIQISNSKHSRKQVIPDAHILLNYFFIINQEFIQWHNDSDELVIGF